MNMQIKHATFCDHLHSDETELAQTFHPFSKILSFFLSFFVWRPIFFLYSVKIPPCDV